MKTTKRAMALVVALIMALSALSVLAEALPNGDVKINAKNFPDAKFRAIVKSRFDRDRDGILSQTEINRVDEIYVGGKGIQDLKGIEYFTKLEVLSCRFNKLKKLDLTKNSKLWSLDCDNNALATLKLGRKSQLSMLNCYNNALDKLDIGGCPIIRDMATDELIYATEERAGYGTGKVVLFNTDIRTKLTNGKKTIRQYKMPKSVKFSRKDITLGVGKESTLDLRGAYVVMTPATSVYPFTISNGNNTVIDMSHRGFYYIKGLRAGRSVITVTCGRLQSTVSATVS